MTIPNLEESTPFGDPPTLAWLTELEQTTDFWNRSPQLQRVAWVAAVEKVSPWGLLMGVQLHQLSRVKPTVVLVGRSGLPGQDLFSGTSLNMYGGLVADSGGGKSATFKLAMSLIQPAHTPVSDGTGQGLVKSIAETEKVTTEDGQRLAEPYYITRFHRHSLVVHAPEIKTLNAEFAREASKTDSMMRSMWSGETVGMTTGDRERRVTLPPNTYRLVGMWGVQPVNASAILAGAEDGTPQRFLWHPAQERRRGIARIDPGHVDFPLPIFGQVGTNPFGTSGGELPTEYRDGDALPSPIWVCWSPMMTKEIQALNEERDRLAERDPYATVSPEQAEAEREVLMQSHLTLTRIKLAAVMGFLHGRPNPTDEDWELAGIQMQVSTRELAGIWQTVQANRHTEIVEKGAERGLEMYAMQDARDRLIDAEVAEIAETIYRTMATEGPFTNRALRNGLSTKRRAKFRAAIDLLDAQGRFATDRNSMYWALYKGDPVPFEKAHLFAR